MGCKIAVNESAVKRRIFTIVIALLAIVIAFVFCFSNAAFEQPPQKFITQPSDAEKFTSTKTIACWGDSLTEGDGASPAVITKNGIAFDISYLSYPDILEQLTGMKTYNYGLSGATSDKIAFMQGGLKDIELFNPSSPISPQIMLQARVNRSDILIIEMGSNGGWNNAYYDLVEQYKSMIEYAHCKEYIIIGDTDDPGESADINQDFFEEGEGLDETTWETALREEFDEHFINMRVYLIENGLEVAGLDETVEDEIYASYGCISPQLRADLTHLNSYGYYAQATAVYEKGKELGYWN